NSPWIFFNRSINSKASFVAITRSTNAMHPFFDCYDNERPWTHEHCSESDYPTIQIMNDVILNEQPSYRIISCTKILTPSDVHRLKQSRSLFTIAEHKVFCLLLMR